MKSQQARRGLILSIVKGSKVSSQDELKEKLAAAGVEVTQATLSRDLKALGIVRVFHPDSGYFYACALNGGQETGGQGAGGQDADGYVSGGLKIVPNRMDRDELFRDIRDIRFSGNLAVIKTKMGHATGVAIEIDQLNIPDVVGTVGGDDTLLVVLRENANQESFLRALRG